MRHRIAGGQLNRTSAHRVAMRRNLAASLFEHETISTTMPKAKHVRGFAEKLITLAKKGDLAARRRAIAILGNRDIVEEVDGKIKKKGTVISKLFSEIAPRYLDRPGGYTRIIKLAKRRLGDNSQLVLLQLVGQESQVEAPKKGGRKKTSKRKTTEKPEAEQASE
ncbi:MAG: 50S ribosomal protein L17 [Sedimentisphaerales bacterium]|nr:50S ribosomal protein L17 [Sedimentisphaerales bacterium]